MKRSESIAQLSAALAAAQGQIRTAPKDNVAKVRMKAGGEYSYKYTTLADIWSVCRKPLSDNGLSVIQIPTNDEGEGKIYLETIIAHSSGEWISGIMVIPIVVDRMSELQAMGNALTYARRYALAAMVGVTSGDDDDDGQSAPVKQEQTPWSEPKSSHWYDQSPTFEKFMYEATSSFGLTEGDVKDELKAAGFQGYISTRSGAMWAALEQAAKKAATPPETPDIDQTDLEELYPDILGDNSDTGGK